MGIKIDKETKIIENALEKGDGDTSVSYIISREQLTYPGKYWERLCSITEDDWNYIKKYIIKNIPTNPPLDSKPCKVCGNKD